MGAYILCKVRRAQNPYYIDSIGLRIYSIEELCYYLCRNLPLLDQTILNEGLAAWLQTELGLIHLGQRLGQLVQREFTIGEYILPILKEINYLNHGEFQELEASLARQEGQPLPVRLKMKGDALFFHEKYIKAIETYGLAMEGRLEANLGSQFQGELYNNMGCAYARLFQMDEACDCFRKAYEALHTQATLKSYLFAIYMRDGKEAYDRAGDRLGVDPATREAMDQEIAQVQVPQPPSEEELEGKLEEWIRAYHRNTGM